MWLYQEKIQAFGKVVFFKLYICLLIGYLHF